MTEVSQEVEKLRNDKCDLYFNREEPGRSLYKRAITECERRCSGNRLTECYFFIPSVLLSVSEGSLYQQKGWQGYQVTQHNHGNRVLFNVLLLFLFYMSYNTPTYRPMTKKKMPFLNKCSAFHCFACSYDVSICLSINLKTMRSKINTMLFMLCGLLWKFLMSLETCRHKPSC